MVTRCAKVKLYVPQCHSLKEKRMILQSIITRTRNKFNVSIAEVDLQDVHQTICLGIAVVSGSFNLAQSVLDEVLRFIEDSFDADFISLDFE